MTSQPNLTALVEALRFTRARHRAGRRRAAATSPTTGKPCAASTRRSRPDIRSGTADVYRHEMPGGQYTNLYQQARALGLAHRWPEVSQAYADVNQLFGDIVKVTPTSKVVGDMALFMVANNLTAADVLDPARELAFPESVVELFEGGLGQPPGGFPEDMQPQGAEARPRQAAARAYRPGDRIAPVDLEAARKQGEAECELPLDERRTVLVPAVPEGDARLLRAPARARRHLDAADAGVLLRRAAAAGDRVEIEPGKTLIVTLQSITRRRRGRAQGASS